MTENEKKLAAGRDECWRDLLALKGYYNDLRNKAVKLGLKIEDVDPKSIELIVKICMAEMTVKHGNFAVTDMEVPKQ